MKIATLILLFIAAILTSCTDQQGARQFGGTSTTDLPINRKLLTVSWKQNDLWILTRPMRKDEIPEVYEFKEQSSWGIIQGTVVLKESKSY